MKPYVRKSLYAIYGCKSSLIELLAEKPAVELLEIDV